MATAKIFHQYPLYLRGYRSEVNMKLIKLKNLAQMYGGSSKVETEESFENDEVEVFITFIFENLDLMKVWASNISTI